MNKSYLVLLFCFTILQACGGGGSSDGDGDPGDGDTGGGGSTQSLSLNPIGNKSVLAGETLGFTLSANDPNGTSRTYMANGTNNVINPLSLTDRVSFNESTGAFTWNTAVSDDGNYNIVFSVTNNAMPAETDSESITISVQNAAEYGETIFVPNCGRCHGNDGLGGGSEGLIGAPTAEQIEQAFALSGDQTMKDFEGVFSFAEREAMYQYLCTFLANSC
jgi:hypothetical protein